jgi:hypothetical protein
MRQHQSGAVLFIIFIAVALFAALIAAVTQGNRASTDTLTREQAKIYINEVRAHAAALQNSISRLQTMNGCTIEQISFQKNSIYGSQMNNDNAPSGFICHIFHENGAKYDFISPPVEMRDATELTNAAHFTLDNAYTFLAQNAVQNVGSESSEPMMVVSFVTNEVCEELNRQEGITNATRSNVDFNAYTSGGIAAASQEIIGDEGTDSDLTGKLMGCVKETTTSTAGNHMFIVLEPR